MLLFAGVARARLAQYGLPVAVCLVLLALALVLLGTHVEINDFAADLDLAGFVVAILASLTLYSSIGGWLRYVPTTCFAVGAARELMQHLELVERDPYGLSAWCTILGTAALLLLIARIRQALRDPWA